MAGTRERILDIAQELFARQGYTATSITDIARGLGTTSAALYYHFPSKAAILDALVEQPVAVYAALAARAGEMDADEILVALTDLAADSRELLALISGDPTVIAVLDERSAVPPRQMIESIIGALAGPGAGRAAAIRAHAAFAVVKEGTLAALSMSDQPLGSADRAEIVAAARRALRG